MELAKMEVSRAEIRKVHRGKLTSGMVGAEVAFSFDDAWDGLNRIAVFKAGGTVKDVLLVGESCVIPHEVLERPVHLVVGVYGTDADGSVVIPTVWADLGMVEQGAKPSGEISKKPTPEVWAQILGMIGDLKKLNTEDKSSLVAAINEVLRKGADPEEVERIVGAYLAENGIGGIHIGPYPPDDPNVDIWLDTSEEETPPYIPNTINAKPGQIVRVVTVDENGAIVAVEAVDMPSGGESYELPAATADALGGVKAEPATEADTQPVRIGADGMLFTTPGGGGEKWETIVDYTVPEDCAQVTLTTDVNGNPFSLKKAVALFRFHPTTTVEGIGYARVNFDASVVNVYGNNGSLHESINIPKNDGEYTFYRVMLEKNNEGITAISRIAVGAQTNNTIVMLKSYQGFYENYDPTTLTPFLQGITAISAGSHNVAIGAGTRIKLLGVRE